MGMLNMIFGSPGRESHLGGEVNDGYVTGEQGWNGCRGDPRGYVSSAHITNLSACSY